VLLVLAALAVLGLASTRVAAASEWHVQSTPNPSGATASELLRVSCASEKACTSVGYYVNGSGVQVTLAEHWNGKEWSLQSTPNPAGAQESYLSVVSCWSAKGCMATGYYKDETGHERTLAEQWNGTEWSISPTPDPAGSVLSTLHMGVSCTSSKACTAVGYYEDGAADIGTLAERWNGTEWSIQTTPNPLGVTEATLQGVSCTTAKVCVAPGYYLNSMGTFVAFAEQWNGKEWSLESMPSPAGATFTAPNGIDCASTTVCTSVGFYRNGSGTFVNLAEQWSASEWAVQSIPNPAGAQWGRLNGVSCPTTTSCTAAGTFENGSGVYGPVAESWNGTEWSIQPTPVPVGATESGLGGVSCATSLTPCVASGAYRNSEGKLLTLVLSQ
jgi:hypothetical protein